MPDVTFERFGGLRLNADPQETGAEGSISCKNVLLDRNGTVRPRPGYTTLYTATGEAPIHALHPSGSGILAATMANVRRIASGGSVTYTAAMSGGLIPSFASINDAVYFSDGSSTQIRKATTAAVSSPASLSALKARLLAAQPLDDRLVIVPPSADSLLYFSDAATPETVDTTNNSLQLTPGDDEAISGMAVYGTELFVFKETKFFVFYGNSTDTTGGTIFNYRMVDAGVGIGSNGVTGPFASHRTGLYFIGNDGVYRTTGGPPSKVSDAIEPLFEGSPLPMPYPFRTDSGITSASNLTWDDISIVNDLLYVSANESSGSAGHQFVLDLNTGQWTYLSLNAYCVLDGALVGQPDFTFFGGTSGSDGRLMKSEPLTTTDASAAITWHHQSGFYDLGSQHTKRTRRSTLWGSGTPTLSVFTDHGTTDSNAAAVTLGTAPAVARGWHNKTYRGVLFSHKLSGTTAATVHRISHQVTDERSGQ